MYEKSVDFGNDMDKMLFGDDYTTTLSIDKKEASDINKSIKEIEINLKKEFEVLDKLKAESIREAMQDGIIF